MASNLSGANCCKAIRHGQLQEGSTVGLMSLSHRCRTCTGLDRVGSTAVLCVTFPCSVAIYTLTVGLATAPDFRSAVLISGDAQIAWMEGL